MRKKLEVQISVADLFTAPTIGTSTSTPEYFEVMCYLAEAMAHKVLLLKTMGSPRMSVSNSDRDKRKPKNKQKVYEKLNYQQVGSGRGNGRFNSLLVAMLVMRLSLAVIAPLTGIAVKWLLIGRYQPGKYPLWGSMYLRWWFVEKVINVFGKGVRDVLSASNLLSPPVHIWYWLMARLLPGGGLGGVTKLVGTHYEIVSIIYRALGAKVGDDVVFGSRTVVLTSTASRSARVVFEAGSMVADRYIGVL
ncbi:unnamed protein product [Sphagnum jensenii]|uniref:Uncharacterized protein n=1 Tax=Sphagnum jensenii TaxID=128206 RepID=A0ABP0VF34_9BRYO